MKLHRVRWIGVLLLGVMALAPVAAHARSGYKAFGQGYGQPYGQAHGQRYIGAPYRIYPDENRWGRSYYYEDPYCGIRSSHLSRLTSHYDDCGHPPVVYMMDNRTGWVINTYSRDHDDWCKLGSGLVPFHDQGRGGWGGYAMGRY